MLISDEQMEGSVRSELCQLTAFSGQVSMLDHTAIEAAFSAGLSIGLSLF